MIKTINFSSICTIKGCIQFLKKVEGEVTILKIEKENSQIIITYLKLSKDETTIV